MALVQNLRIGTLPAARAHQSRSPQPEPSRAQLGSASTAVRLGAQVTSYFDQVGAQAFRPVSRGYAMGVAPERTVESPPRLFIRAAQRAPVGEVPNAPGPADENRPSPRFPCSANFAPGRGTLAADIPTEQEMPARADYSGPGSSLRPSGWLVILVAVRSPLVGI